MEHGVPIGIGEIVALQLPQNLCREDKEQDDDLQRIGQVDVEPPLHQRRQHKEDQGQQAGEGTFVVAPEDMVDQKAAHDDTQRQIQRQNCLGAPGRKLRRAFPNPTHCLCSSLSCFSWLRRAT